MMSSFIWNLIEVNVVIILLFVGYMIIRNQLTFKLRRGVLIGLPFLAVIAIITKSLVDFSRISYSMPIVKLKPIIVGHSETMIQGSEPSIDMMFIYGIGALCFGLLLVFRLSKLGLFFTQNNYESNGKYRIYRVDGKSSFSFFNHIQITPGLGYEEGEVVLEHEKVHVDKMHSFDTIIIELFHTTFWFNPVFFFLKRELINLHEFEVDTLMYKKYKVDYMKFLVQHALGLTTSNYLLTSRFYNRLTLKKRIKIMKTNYKKRSWILGLIPLVAISVILIQCTKVDLNSGLVEESENVLEQDPVVDGFEVCENSINSGVGLFMKYFIGGDNSFISSLYDNLKYPEEAIENNEEGNVFVEFIVSKEGEIEKCWVEESISESLDKEAIRAVSQVAYFEPTIIDGEAIRVQYSVPVVFTLENAEKINAGIPEN